MRDRDTIDAELRLLAAVRRSIREQGGEPSSRQVDELLDERLTVSGHAEGFANHIRLPGQSLETSSSCANQITVAHRS
jgi:hypothetical protein